MPHASKIATDQAFETDSVIASADRSFDAYGTKRVW
jgi:hypothetical protein